MIDKGHIIAEVLKNLGILDDLKIEEALKIQLDKKERFSRVLMDLGCISNENIGKSLLSQFGIIPIEISKIEFETDAIYEIPPELAQKHHIISYQVVNSKIKVVTDDPLNLLARENLEKFCGKSLEFELASQNEFNEVLAKIYGAEYGKREKNIDAIIGKLSEDNVPIAEGLPAMVEGKATKEEAPIIRLVTLFIAEAVKNRASDIHIEPLEKKLRVRYRIDGVLHEVPGPPKKLQGSVISRIKLMAGLDIAEKRLPQDGRIRINLAGKYLDLRVSTIPGIYGESTVMRILDKSSLLKDLSEVGFLAEDQHKFEELISLPNGMILVTGPTGSGKTTTLYAALSKINQPNKKLITVEDPVEYQISGINQVQIKPQVGLTFAGGLRAILRQAPDVILVGEIRDFETATIAIQASLTGHLIFSTLHTNDAAGAVTRLIDMGVKPYLIASTVQAILAQRLVRKICSSCKKVYKPNEEELILCGLKKENVKNTTFYRGAGCNECSNTGYRGRIPIFELLVVTDRIRNLFFEKISSTLIKEKGRQEGMHSLREDGVKKVLMGITTFSEILRVTHSDVD
ncbi:MAG: type II secretion system ATPase GspE [Candidatus Omnitrophota bacterium]